LRDSDDIEVVSIDPLGPIDHCVRLCEICERDETAHGHVSQPLADARPTVTVAKLR